MSLRRYRFFEVIYTFLVRFVLHKSKRGYGHFGKNSYIHTPSISGYGQKNIFIGNNCTIDWNNVLYCDSAKFIMKDNSGAAVGLTVVTGNHIQGIGKVHDEENDNLEGEDIIIEEDVWLGANVTLLSGAHIGRGAIVGAGSVVRKCNVPPYSIVIGNPAKVVGFKWTVEEMMEHEQKVYKVEDRIDSVFLQKNYEKYFLNRISDIKKITRL